MDAPPFLASNGRTRRLTGRPLSTGQFSDLFQAAAHVGVVVTLSEASGNSYCTWAGAGSGNGVSRIPGVPAGRETLIARRVTETRIGLSGRPSSRRQEGLGKRPIPSRGSMPRRSPIRGPNRAPLGPEHAFLPLSEACESHLCVMPGPVSPEFAGPVTRLARPARRGRLRVCKRNTNSKRLTDRCLLNSLEEQIDSQVERP